MDGIRPDIYYDLLTQYKAATTRNESLLKQVEETCETNHKVLDHSKSVLDRQMRWEQAPLHKRLLSALRGDMRV